MKERQIRFNAPMVRAILEGRKTQTRWTVKPKVEELIRCHAGDPGEDEADVYFSFNQSRDLDGKVLEPQWLVYSAEYPEEGGIPIGQCPYGKPGDRLWVRETWIQIHGMNGVPQAGRVLYRADARDNSGARWHSVEPGDERGEVRWSPSIHMPRWASRINLEITGIRIERLQDISDDDAIAEGVESDHTEAGPLYWVGGLMQETVSEESPVESFQKLWESINGTGSWDANPWVWVIEFKRIPS